MLSRCSVCFYSFTLEDMYVGLCVTDVCSNAPRGAWVILRGEGDVAVGEVMQEEGFRMSDLER